MSTVSYSDSLDLISNYSQADIEIVRLMQDFLHENPAVLELAGKSTQAAVLIQSRYHQTSVLSYKATDSKAVVSYIEYLLSGNLEETFDYIIINGVMEHTDNPRVLINLCSRLLSDGGRLIVRIPNIMYYRIISKLLSGSLQQTTDHICINKDNYLYTWDDAAAIFRSEGYEIEECVYTNEKNQSIQDDRDSLVNAVSTFNSTANKVMFYAYEYIFRLRRR